MQVLLLFILKLGFVVSGLSVEYIQKVVNEVFIDENEFLRETLANPVFGLLADGLGLTNNIRFYSPALQTTFRDGKRIYVEDKSDDPLTSFIIQLYPSPAGILAESTLWRTNPLSFFKINIEESIKFYAKIFISVIEKNENFLYEFTKYENETPGAFKRRKQTFNEIGSLILKKPILFLFEDDVMVKLLLIHSYIIRALDPANNYKEDCYFKIYLQEIIEGFKNNVISKVRIDINSINQAVESYNFMNFFPYSEFNQPQSNKRVHPYNRKTGTFDEKIGFEDCTEVTLLQLCNCLFFKDGKYSVKHLPNASKELKEFYEEYKEVYPLSDKIRMEWLKVVSDLPQGENNFSESSTDNMSIASESSTDNMSIASESSADNISESSIDNTSESSADNMFIASESLTDINSRFPTQKFLYIRKNNNELYQGMINMMNVLITITGIDKNKFFKDINKENLFDRFEILLNEIAIGDEVKNIVQLKKGYLKEYMTNKIGKFDFLGDFTLQFNYSSGNKAEIKIENNIKHVGLSLLSSKKIDMKSVPESESETLNKKIKIDNILAKIIRNYILKRTKEELQLDKPIFESICISKLLLKNEDKKNILTELSKLLKILNLNENKEEIELLESIGKRILDSVEFNDFPTKKLFFEFLFWSKELKITDSYELLYFSSKIRRSENEYLNAKWIQYFEDQKINITKIYNLVNFCDSDEIEEVFINKIHEFINLETFIISIRYLDEKTFKTLLINLKKCEKLKSLNLSGIKFDQIPEEINQLTNLKNLKISLSEEKKIKFSISKLINLEELSFNNIDLSEVCPTYFSNLTMLEKVTNYFSTFKTLENLTSYFFNFKMSEKTEINFSNFKMLEKITIKFSKITKIPDSFFENDKLKHLDLSNNTLKTSTDLSIKFKGLKSLNLSKCELQSVPKFIENLKNLECLDLSNNDFSDTFPKFLSKMKKLKELNLNETKTTKMPFFIADLKNLEILQLSFNNVTFVPKSMADIIFNLKYFSLIYNHNFQNESYEEQIGRWKLKEVLGYRLMIDSNY